MKIRLRLILAFFLLAVVPLTGLVLYSYHASLQAVRQSTEEEAIATLGELERRMTEVREDLAASFERVASMPSEKMPHISDEGTSASGAGAMDAMLNHIIDLLGEDAGLVEALEIIPVAPEAPRPEVSGRLQKPASAVPVPPNPETPPIVISSLSETETQRSSDGTLTIESEDNQTLSLDGQLTLDFSELENAETLGEIVQTLAAGANVLQALGAFEEPTEGEAELWGNSVRYRLEKLQDPDANRRWRAFMTTEVDEEDLDEEDLDEEDLDEEDLEDAHESEDLASIESRQERNEARQASRLEERVVRHEQRRARHEARRVGARQEEQAQLETEVLMGRQIAIPLREGDRLMAQVRPEIRAGALLRRVLDFSDRTQGEVPFALDSEGQLFVSEEADRDVLNQLDLTTTESPNVQEIDEQPWVVAALEASDGKFTFGIARPLGGPLAEIRRTASRNFAYGLGLVGLALFGIAPLSRRITGDLQTVTQGAERIAAGDLATRVAVRSSDEIGQLAETFNSMARQLADHEEQREEDARRRRDEALQRHLLEAEVDRQTRELEEAREFQLSLLPKSLPAHPSFEMAVEIRTATEVGGDYYDFLHTEDALTVAIGDATGHGARAGTMVTVTKSLFSAYSPSTGPGAFLQEATQTIRRMDLGRMNMALSIGELRADRLRLATAGMPPVLLYRAAEGQVEELSVPGLPLGSRLGTDYQELEVELKSGDTMLWTTDGVPELIADGPCSPQGEVFGYEQLRQTFQDVAEQSPAQILAALSQAIDTWCCNERPNDDITLLVIEKR